MSDRPWVAHYPKDVPTHLEYPAEPVYWLLEDAAERFPTRVACRYYRQELTYGQLLDQSRRMAAALRARGLQPGDRVGILLPNVPEYLIALFGTWMAGGVAVPINPLMVAEEVAALLRTTSCRFVVCLDLLLPLLGTRRSVRPDVVFVTSLKDRLPWLTAFAVQVRPAPPARASLAATCRRRRSTWTRRWRRRRRTPTCPRPSPEDPAHILPTGGTTGWPKAVLLTHRNLLANAWQVSHWAGRPVRARTSSWPCLPFFHSYGLTVCGLTGVAMGATLVLHHRFRAGHGPEAHRAVAADARPGRPGDAGRVQQGAPAAALRPELGPRVSSPAARR